MIEQLEYEWSNVRDEAVAAFSGQTPRPEDESAVIEIFERQPVLVKRTIDEVSAAFQQGQFRWAWSVLRSRLERAVTPTRQATAKDTSRERKVASAEQWIRTAGIHYDRLSEIEDELFGHGGKLHAYADEDALRDRIAELWRELRPKGKTVEREESERAARWKGSRRPLPPLWAEPSKPNPFL